MNDLERLAQLIRDGLATPGVVEDSHIYGAEIYDGQVHANAFGLAVIGKIGLKPAVGLFEAVLPQLGHPGGVVSQIADQLAIELNVIESLCSRHTEVNASAIIGELKNGTFEVAA